MKVCGFALFIYLLAAYAVWRGTHTDALQSTLLFLGYVTLPIIIMWSVSQFYAFYHHRYFLFGGVGLYALAGAGLSWLCLKCTVKHRYETQFIFVGVWFFMLMGFNGQFEDNHELQDSAAFLYNHTNSTPVVVLHTSPFSMTPYKVYLPEYEHHLVTTLTRQQLFTAGGSAIKDSELHHKWISSDYIVTDYNLSLRKIWGEGGLNIYVNE